MADKRHDQLPSGDRPHQGDTGRFTSQSFWKCVFNTFVYSTISQGSQVVVNPVLNQFCVISAPQVAVVSAFAQTLRRYTSLNHLAQAARAVLQNTSQINQMLSDLNRVDFANVQVSCSSVVQFISV